MLMLNANDGNEADGYDDRRSRVKRLVVSLDMVVRVDGKVTIDQE